MKSSEEQLQGLLVRGLTGDQGAYHAFLSELSAVLRGYFRKRLLQVPTEAEDLVQETLLAIHLQRHTYHPSEPLTPWVFAIARYKWIDFLRRHARTTQLHEPLDEESGLIAEQDDDAAQAQRDVFQLLASLPERQRLPIMHMKLEGLSVADTARRTGMSESAVKVGVHRGLKALAAKIRRST